ncbi:AGAP009782-PA-like protein [Anopheles sinensis]|uniref:AGAP009782-PA-like protein n=1 Tax=Anopheles sinensis TaxID=74873 RepID=A0A084WG82_ANOSI|nr:AGAP009782-PA-like protein [Anopheles sinensis]
MDYSRRVDMVTVYREPACYRPPNTLVELAKDTEYPNMNSIQYRKTPAVEAPEEKLSPFIDHVAANGAGHVIVAGNQYTSRQWGSKLCGWESPADILREDKVSFFLRNEASVTALCYTKDDELFLQANDRGSIELWSTGNPVRGPGYSLYQVDNRNEHIGAVTAVDIFRGEERHAISGSTDGCLKLWDYSEGDLHSTTTMHHAHSGPITDVATDSTQSSLAVTCSRDRSALLWDFREMKPATALYEKHDAAFTAIRWPDEVNWKRLVAIGDEAGRVFFIDVRQPNVFLETIDCFDRKVHKLSFQG